MKKFLKKAPVDERILQVKRQIHAEMLLIIYYFIIIAFAVKTLLLHYSLDQCIVEYCIILFVPLYQMVRTRQLKVVLIPENYRANRRNAKEMATFFIVYVACMAVFIATGGLTDPQGWTILGITFVVCFIVFCVSRQVFIQVEERRRKKLEDEFSAEEALDDESSDKTV